jgi:hypothetical protein
MSNYSPQMTKKMDTKWLPLATAPILGQAPGDPVPKKRIGSPILWIALAIVGLILVLLLVVDRGPTLENSNVESNNSDHAGHIDRALLIPPGLRARQLIEKIRKPDNETTLEEVVAQGLQYQNDGNLADAHLIFFFAARKGNISAMMRLGEMNDPTLFRADQSLLDQSDPVQAYKWYWKAQESGHSIAKNRLGNLHQWALAESKLGNPHAQLLLLNFR